MRSELFFFSSPLRHDEARLKKGGTECTERCVPAQEERRPSFHIGSSPPTYSIAFRSGRVVSQDMHARGVAFSSCLKSRRSGLEGR